MAGMQMSRKIFPVLAALLLGACAPVFNGPEQALTVAQRHPISVDPANVTMLVPVPPHRVALPEEDRNRIRRFAAAWRELGYGPISLSTPTGGANAGSARSLSNEVREVLVQEGVPADVISEGRYTPAPTEREASLVLSFIRYVATPSPCGDWSQNAARSSRNTPMSNFGCAIQNNVAVMVADPHDLLAPQKETAADAARRSTALGAYRSGKSTATQYPEDSEASVSAVSQ
jgi:pilus assembly protein CpaD